MGIFQVAADFEKNYKIGEGWLKLPAFLKLLLLSIMLGYVP